ncbi:MAG: ArsA-related P-loop ATPase [Solirubrobacteraceae bacterium]|jgi:anion-transporting  ArsA/GET3 family ATPase
MSVPARAADSEVSRAQRGLGARLAGMRVVICAGAGGVGKTTVSAAVALGLAAGGLRVAVVTIDPARRLAEALGFDQLGNQPRRVEAAALRACGLECSGELSAMMLDVKRTFDEVIVALAPDAATRDAILANRVYQQLSTAVAGSQEYTAIAKLFELVEGGDYDAIVLDTPPSRSAIDFLQAPERLSGFLESRVLATFLAPTGRMIRAAALVFGAIRRITGVGLLDDLTTFFGLLSGLLDGFHRRAAGVQQLLADPRTAFLIVTSPERGPSDEGLFFARELERGGMRRAGVIVNRVHALDRDLDDAQTTAQRLAGALGAELASEVAAVHARVQLLARRDHVAVARLCVDLDERAPVCVLDRERDLHDLVALVELCAELFAPVA